MYFVITIIFFLQINCINFLYSEAVDVIYTWVNGSDVQWQELRNKYFKEHCQFLVHDDANSNNRYRNRDELKYSLRSLREYAPFVNHIYIVTCGQRPKWLKDDPRITVVDHKDIFLNSEDLPTFNSQAIEANLHRIPNLAEKFIYFNDDVLLIHPVTVEDFFTQDGKIRVGLDDKYMVPSGPVMSNEVAYDSAWRNSAALLNLFFKKEKRHKLAHAPFAFTKSLVHEVEARWGDIFHLVSSHRFRMPSDFTLTNGLIPYYAYYTNRAQLSFGTALMIRVYSDPYKNAREFSKINGCASKFLCIEDLGGEDDILIDDQVRDFLDSCYPNIAPWEKPCF